MSWEEEVRELEARRAMAAEMGGPEGVARQRKRGKLTVRERIDAISDPGSFREFMGLTGTGTYENNKLSHFLPRGLVEGIAKLDGRKVILTAGDFTVRGGSGGSRGGMGQELRAAERALEWRLPYVRLLDAAGGSVRSFEEMGRTYLPDGNAWVQHEVSLLSAVPVVSAVLGSVAGLPAVQAPLAHFSLMVEGMSQIFPGGPPVVKAALGYDITKEDLGGDHIHVRESGCVDNLAKDEADAYAQIRTFLSYLPSSVHEMAPRGDTSDDPNRCEDMLLSAMPKDRRKVYNARKILRAVVDQDSFFEIAPLYGRARITGLARLNGYPVGIMINNPRFNGSSTDVAAGSKVMRLMQLCDTFHIPLISLADEPGFMVGLESEKQGIERAGARMVAMVCNSRMPWATVVMGRVYGVAGQCHHRPSGMFRRYCWPSANWGSMHISGGASAAYRAEIEAADDPDAKREEIEARLQALASPFLTAETTGQDIIDPRETRPLLCEFVEDAQRILHSQLGAPHIPYLP
ncbi:MAG: carboxyl transferase domain-containing protein [Alphaproteobacteria bacterium]|nr:carboxyl transferase domain-containing protein [Alphaproteobacteria bacterium]